MEEIYEAYHAKLDQIVRDFDNGDISINEMNRIKSNIDRWLYDELSEARDTEHRR